MNQPSPYYNLQSSSSEITAWIICPIEASSTLKNEPHSTLHTRQSGKIRVYPLRSWPTYPGLSQYHTRRYRIIAPKRYVCISCIKCCVNTWVTVPQASTIKVVKYKLALSIKVMATIIQGFPGNSKFQHKRYTLPAYHGVSTILISFRMYSIKII